MRYFFIHPSDISFPNAFIRGNDANHIRSVLRLKPGGLIRFTDGSDIVHEARIVHFSDTGVELRIESQIHIAPVSAIHLTVAQPFLKHVKPDLLIRPLSELGVSTLVVFLSERSISRPSADRLSERETRWRKIAREALKQCGRSAPMDIVTVFSFQDMLEQSERYDLKIIFWEKATEALDYPNLVQDRPVERIFSLFGPEGGFTDREYNMAREHGFLPSSLGPRILRAETAPLAASAVLQYVFGDMRPKS